jgi:two-component system, chemotaxis family, protein-glutamate methylesterase/glutaminase
MKNGWRHDIVVIGGSAGAFEPLRRLLSLLPADLPIQIFITIHIPADFPSLLPELLSQPGGWTVRHPAKREPFQRGVIWAAPPDSHLLVEKSHVSLSAGPRENRHRPAIDVLFRSASRAYDGRVAAVVLSGQLDDGAAGLMAVNMSGGVTIAQDPREASAPEMPSRAIQYAEPDYVLPVEKIAQLLINSANPNLPLPKPSEVPMNKKTDQELAVAKMEDAPAEEKIGQPSVFACPECHGVLWEIDDGKLMRFRCRVGHAYTADALRVALSETAEDALWVAMRVLEEKAALLRRLANRSGLVTTEQFREEAAGFDQHAETIRKMLTENRALSQNEEDAGSKVA